MKIALCGSMAFSKEMLEIKYELQKLGYDVEVPLNAEDYAVDSITEEDKWRKINHNVFKEYFERIKTVGAILVVNIDKNNIAGYVGGNSLIEMGFAHVLDKKIYLLNPIPEISYRNEIEAMAPVILNGDLSKI